MKKLIIFNLILNFPFLTLPMDSPLSMESPSLPPEKALCMYASLGNLDEVKDLLEKQKTDPDTPSCFPPAIICAANAIKNDDLDNEKLIEIIKELILHKANINTEDEEGNTALSIIIYFTILHNSIIKLKPIINFLIENGADVNSYKHNQHILEIANLYHSRLIEYPNKQQAWLGIIENLLERGAGFSKNGKLLNLNKETNETLLNYCNNDDNDNNAIKQIINKLRLHNHIIRECKVVCPDIENIICDYILDKSLQ